jgi:hypothetical protein
MQMKRIFLPQIHPNTPLILFRLVDFLSIFISKKKVKNNTKNKYSYTLTITLNN